MDTKENSIPHAVPLEELARQFEVSLDLGHSSNQVERLRSNDGFNEIAVAPPTPRWRRFLAQFASLVIGILLVAAILAGVMGEWIDTIAILAIVVLNSILGFYQEERAERSLESLRKLSAPLAKVRRDGEVRSIPTRELVTGDCIELEAGDSVPADARLTRAFGLRVQEAALTGESAPVDKDASRTLPTAISLADRLNMVFSGTVVVAGQGSAVVTATGMRTELGKIAGLLRNAPHEPTPLQRRLSELGRILVLVCLAIVLVIFVLQARRGNPLEAMLTAVSLAVAAVPEGLPAVVTIALALGLQRMVQRNALVRKLPSVETLGSVTVICSDKTGTLTRNEMMVCEIFAGDAHYDVTGEGYEPRGDFRLKDHEESRRVPLPLPFALHQTLLIGHRCNHAALTSPTAEQNEWRVAGDPTEGALLVAARKGGIEQTRERAAIEFELPFDSERKAMSVVVRDDAGKLMVYTKGAPEVILQRCTHITLGEKPTLLDESNRSRLRDIHSSMAQRALRVLALASRPWHDEMDTESLERDLAFSGFVGMIDPPRHEARLAVEKCRGAGIIPVMITGDHPETAIAIARQLGIAAPDQVPIAGETLDQWSDADLEARVPDQPVYARVTAEHKLRVVRAWQKSGHVVAMTGDGVNDAPAIQAADIGIAMGITGTDVTKDAADMVLTDDNFASIVNAVEEGRGIYDNIQKVVLFLLASNASEVLLMLIAALLGWPAPLLPLQILWINLVTDGLPALALALEPPERDIMRRPPRPVRQPVLTWNSGGVIALQGVLMGSVGVLTFSWLFHQADHSLVEARTATFSVMALTQLSFAFACRSLTRTMPELGFFTNPKLFMALGASAILQVLLVVLPFTRGLFDLEMLGKESWIIVVGLALIPVTLIEVTKIVRARFGARP